MTDVAHLMRGALETAGVSQTDLAEHLEVSQPTVSRWLRGDHWPHRSHWAKIEQYLQLPPKSIARAAGFDNAGSVEARIAALEEQVATLKRLIIGRIGE